MRSQQEEAKRKQVEEARKRAEEDKKRMLEQIRKKKSDDQTRLGDETKSCFQLRRLIAVVRSASEKDLAEKQQELAEALQKDITKCGAQAEKIKQESQMAVEFAKKRIEMEADHIKRLKEAAEKAEAMLKELSEKVEAAEKPLKSLTEATEALEAVTVLKLRVINRAGEKADEAISEATKALEDCASYIKEFGTSFPAIPSQKESPVAALSALVVKFHQMQNSKTMLVKKASDTKQSLLSKLEAKTKLDGKAAKFAKYDLNKDGVLDEKEILAYAKKEFGVSLPKARTAKIMAALHGKKGAGADDFQMVTLQIGMAREAMKDSTRKKEREVREKKLGQMKSTLEGKVAEIDQELATLDQTLKEADQTGTPLRGKQLEKKTAAEISPLVEEIEAKLEKAKETLAEARNETGTLAEDVHPELLEWITSESKKLTGKASGMQLRIEALKTLMAKANASLKKKEASEMKTLESQVGNALRSHQVEKDLTVDQVFDALSNKKEKVDRASFLAFMKNCKKVSPKAESGDSAEVSDSFAVEVLERLFKYLAETDKSIGKERIMSMLRTYMKVSKETVLTNGLSIKTSKPMRRLEVGEVVELLGNPVAEGAVGIKRIECRAMSDGLEGWVTVSGNMGSNFLEAYTPAYKVVKETTMTEAFEQVSEATSKDDTPKLKIGEQVEVLVWPKKEEQSGFQRMKCRRMSDSLVGWVTVVGDAGTKFLDIL